jgi:hypothetical protein
LVDVARVLLYTRNECAYSDDLRERLRCGADILEEVNLTREPQAMTEFLKLTGGRRIVPVMVKGAVIEIAPDGGTEF